MLHSSFIYKRDSHGKIRTWSYEVDGNQWRTHAGLLDGQTVTSGWTVCDRAKSQATPEDQAVFEAKAEESKKLERDYHTTIEGCDTPNYFKPMLAKKYEGFPGFCLSQPKLDGIRCIATKNGLFSREGKRFFSVPHIEDELEAFFNDFPDAVLDGELYNHDLKADFEKIVSMVRKQKPDQEAIDIAKKLVQYHVYDVLWNDPVMSFMTRHVALSDQIVTRAGASIVVVDFEIIDDEADLDESYAKYLSDGYEGQMVRLNERYEQKRSKFLLKRKEFLDDEFVIVDIESGLGNWAGYGKKIKFRMPDGRVVGAGVRGSQSFTRSLLENREYWIGKQVTIRYFTPTADGIPRFPVAVAFHDGERL